MIVYNSRDSRHSSQGFNGLKGFAGKLRIQFKGVHVSQGFKRLIVW